MKKKVYKVLTVVLVIGLVVGCAGVVRHQVDLHKGAQDYADAEAIAGFSIPSGVVQEPEKAEQPEQDQEPEAPAEEALPAPVQALRGLDLEALQEVNGEAGGWLRIPGIAISYPLMFGGDNDYYLNHTWKKETSAVGSIFLDCRNNSDFQDFNTLVYGHRMRNESMFGLLAGYKDLEFWEKAPSVYIVDQRGISRYDIFAAYEVSVLERTYRLDLQTDAEKEDFIAFALESSAIDTGLVPTAQDKILTLSTCTGRGHATRWVVQAYLTELYENP